MTDTVVKPSLLNGLSEKFNSVKTSADKLQKKISNITTPFQDKIGSFVEDIKKPVVELQIFSIQIDKEGNRYLQRKLWINNNHIYWHFKDELINDWGNYAELHEVAIMGFQVETASIYGRKMELSITEYKDLVWNSIGTGDIIMMRTYYEDQIDKFQYTFEDYIDGGKKEEDLTGMFAEMDFSGFITAKSKSLASSEQFRVEAIDLIKILQQINIAFGQTAITTLDAKGKEKETGFKKNELGTILVNTILETVVGENKNFGDVSKKSHYKDKTKVVLKGELEWGELLLSRHHFVHDFSQIAMLKLQTNAKTKNATDSWLLPTFQVYMFFLTPIKAVELIINNLLNSMGLGKYFDILLSQEIAKWLFDDSVFLYTDNFNDLRNVPQMMIPMYFYDGDGELDLFNNKDDLDDIKKSFMFYSINKLPLFEQLDLTALEDEVKNNCFFVTSNYADVLNNLTTVADHMVEEYNDETNKYHSFRENYTGNDAKFFDIITKFRFNSFFESIDGSSIAIRSAKFVSDRGSVGTANSMPMSQLLYYSFSLFNNTPVYTDPFRNNFKRDKIKSFKSHDYLHTLSQVTWFTSVFANMNGRFSFFIHPLSTQLQYTADKNHSVFGERANYKNTDALEMEFQQLELNNRILFINDSKTIGNLHSRDPDRFPVRDGSWIKKREYVSLRPDKDKKANLNMDMFGEQMFNVDDLEKTSWSLLEAFKRETIYDAKDADDYMQKYIPHTVRLFMGGTDNFIYQRTGSTSYTAGVRIFVRHKGDPPVADIVGGKPVIGGDTIPFHSISYGEEPIDVIHRSVTPLTYMLGGMKDGGVIRNNRGYRFVNEGAGANTDFLTLTYDMKFDIRSNNDGFGNEIAEFKTYTVPLTVTGVTSYIQLDRLEKNLEFLFHKNIIPDDMRKNIIFTINKLNPNTLLYDLDASDLSIFQMQDYLSTLFDKIKSLNKSQNNLPYEVYIQPDLGAVYDAFKDFHADGLFGTSTSPNIDETLAYVTAVKFMRNILAHPIYSVISTKQFMRNCRTVMKEKWDLEDDSLNPRISFDSKKSLKSEYFDIESMWQLLFEIVKWISVYETFVKDILRRTYENGSLYLANEGYFKKKVGEYINLIDDRQNFHLKDSATILDNLSVPNLKKLGRYIKVMKSDENTTERDNGRSDVEEALFSNNQRAIYSASRDPNKAIKPFSWMIWKTITYMGDSSGGGGGTSGYTQKVYLTRDGVNFTGFYDEKNFISALASQLSDRGYDVIEPKLFLGS